MATLGQLIISLEANTAKFEAAMTKAEYTAKKAADSIAGALKVVGVAVAGMFSISALDAGFTRITEMESALLKMATRLNTTVETLSSFSVMARKTGMDTEAFNTALTRMERNVSTAALANENATTTIADIGESSNKAAGALREMGLKADVVNELPLDQKLMAFAAGMTANVAPADQVRVAMDLFGRGGAGMVNILNQGPEAMQKWIDRAQELGIITTDMAKRATEAKSAAGDLSLAWNAFARDLVDAVAPAITTVLNLLTEMIARRQQAMAIQGMVHGETSWDPNEFLTHPPEPKPAPSEAYRAALTTATREKPTSGGGGGGAKDMGLDRMQSIIDTLQKDLSRLTEGSLAEITSWATKTINEIEKVGKKGADTEEALSLVAQVEAAKKKKATEDYEVFVAKESGNAYVEIEAQARAWLEKYKGFADAEANIANIKDRKVWEQQVKNYQDVLGLQKGLYDSLASLSPIVEEQNALKRKSLDLEIEMNKYATALKLTELERAGIISKAQSDEFRGLQALESQAKKTSLAMEQNKGLTGWAYGRAKTDSQKNTISDLMGGAENYIQQGLSSGIQGVLSHDKNNLKKIGETIVQGFIGEMMKQNVTKTFSNLAKLLAPNQNIGASTIGGNGQDIAQLQAAAAAGSVEAAKQLSASAGNLRGSAGDITGSSSIALNNHTMAATQLGLSAGGMLVAGAGVMTGSQELLYAGVALQTAAFLLELAATMDAIPFFHSGGVITAHGGWPLKSDEVPIIAQTGERVLSRRQNRDYEAGMGGSSSIVVNVNHSPTYLYRATESDYKRDARMIVKAINQEVGGRGQRLGDGRT